MERVNTTSHNIYFNVSLSQALASKPAICDLTSTSFADCAASALRFFLLSGSSGASCFFSGFLGICRQAAAEITSNRGRGPSVLIYIFAELT